MASWTSGKVERGLVTLTQKQGDFVADPECGTVSVRASRETESPAPGTVLFNYFISQVRSHQIL